MKTIEVENVGAVEKVSIPCPEGGGLVVLRGRNGRGKSTTLDAIQSAVTGKGKLDPRDGTLRGTVSAFGVQITAARSTTRRGELEVHSLDGRLDVAALVDPGIKDPLAADAKRVKALVTLTGAKADASLFAPLVGGKERLGEIAKPTSIIGDDLVVMADRIKRDIEAKAREFEGVADNLRANAEALKAVDPELQLDGEADEAALNAALEDAIRRSAEIKQQKTASEAAASRVAGARAILGDADAAQIEAKLADAQRELAGIDFNIGELEDELAKARQHLAMLEQRDEALTASRKAASKAIESLLAEQERFAKWQKIADEAIPQAPTEGEISAAELAVTLARSAVERGVLIRDARRKIAEGERVARQSQVKAIEAEKLRTAAKEVDNVLSEVVAKSGVDLRVEAGRLVLDTRRGATYFDDLSHGERWKIALEIAIRAVGPGGVLVIPQEAYEGLDPVNRDLIARQLAGSGVVAFTAEASGDEQITAEVVGVAA